MKRSIEPLPALLHEPSCHVQVGAPDPDRHTSPIVDAADAIHEVLPNEHLHACLFNDVAHAIGEVVQSGTALLRCAAPGVWVRESPAAPPGPQPTTGTHQRPPAP